ncbi:7291_t:CDS:2, partial [Funneliformis caledonium]
MSSKITQNSKVLEGFIPGNKSNRNYDVPKDPRKWTVNSAIQNKVRNDVYFVDLEETNVPFLDKILSGEFVTLYGARASGKSTRVFQAMEKLKSQGIVCIYVTFEHFNLETKDRFWLSMGTALNINSPKYFGNAIHSYLMPKLDENRRLGFSTWLNFVISYMQDTIFDYSTFRKMVTTLKKKETRPAIELLRSVFLGFFDFVPINDPEEKRLAEFLTAEGVLMRDEMKKNNFRMSSIFTDDLIRQQVIPVLYKSAPTCAIPLKKNDFPDTLKILQTAIQFFDKGMISNGFIRSFKSS